MSSAEQLPSPQRDALSLALPLGLPAGAEIQQVAFVGGDSEGRAILLEIREPRACRAVLASGASSIAPDKLLHEVSLLLIPSTDPETPELTAIAAAWLEPGVPLDLRQAQLITLQGTRVLWSPGKAAILAPPNRLETLRAALLEFSFHAAEIREIEQALALAWPELEADTPIAFQYDDRAAARRDQLAQRFQRVIAWRTKLVRINPVVHRPPVHPLTLAAQLAERLRERVRMAERLEFLSGQLEVFERVYEMCGQRSSEYALSQDEKVLEWIIILLLATETIVLLVGLMANQGT